MSKDTPFAKLKITNYKVEMSEYYTIFSKSQLQ